MKITLHQDIEGHKSTEVVDVPAERAQWYIENGYASRADLPAKLEDRDDMLLATSTKASKDPMLAENREAHDKPEDMPGYVDPEQANSAGPGPLTPVEAFDPSTRTVGEVTAYLDALAPQDTEEHRRVLLAESEEHGGKGRKTILEHEHTDQLKTDTQAEVDGPTDDNPVQPHEQPHPVQDPPEDVLA